MLTRIKCKIRGHEMACNTVITLDPEGFADVDHTHTCGRCGGIRFYPREELPAEMVSMLQGLMAPQKHRVTFDADPPSYIH